MHCTGLTLTPACAAIARGRIRGGRGLAAEQAVDTGLHEVLLPTPDHGLGRADAGAHRPGSHTAAKTGIFFGTLPSGFIH
jgi:hypothetical protein